MELALRVDNMEASVPQLYRSLSSPSTIGSRPDPARCTRRAGKMHDSERGPEPAKRATIPRAVLPQRDPPARTVPRSGSTSQPKGHLYPSDSDRLPPERPGSQSDAAAARRHGAGTGRREFRDCVDTHGACSRTRTTRRGYHLPGTARLDAQGLSTRAGDYHPSSAASGQRPGARPNAWNNDSEGCRTQKTRILPTVLLPGDGPAREVPSWFRH